MNRTTPFIFTMLLALEIFYFSTLQLGGTKTTSFLSIVYHFSVFFLFSFFLFFTIKGKSKLKIKHITTTILISVLYAISDEVHQIFVPLRNAGITDILTDSAGIFISTLAYIIICARTRRTDETHHPFFLEEYEDENAESADQQS